MNAAIIAAIITGSISLVGIFLSNHLAAKRGREEHAQFASELYAQLDKQSALADAKLEAKIENYNAVVTTKLDELTREVREHNNFARRIPALETKIEYLEKTAAKRG